MGLLFDNVLEQSSTAFRVCIPMRVRVKFAVGFVRLRGQTR